MPESPWNLHPQQEELVSGHRPQCFENPKRLKHYLTDTAPGGVGHQMPMNDKFLRNREGKIIARHDGGWLRDGIGKLVARCDWDNRTRDANGKIVGDGDQRLRKFGER